MNHSTRFSTRVGLVLAVTLVVWTAGLVAAGCNRQVERTGAYSPSSSVDCLANLTLTDQNGKKVSLASLKGKPALFDFIYASCPGPCLMLTSRMRLIANRLGPMLGSKVWFVSVTVDPEHDGAAELLNYAKQQGADRNGWLFLTGSPADIEQLMNRFKLVRQREADGTVDHVLEFFLVGPDGRQLYQYAASHAEPALVSSDIRQAAETGSASAEDHAQWKVHL
ncbi:MAG: SCO family protein [Deltaproteobacteria bacterium]|nr:SCO family protein [Deltaproteobacteria bacterium]